MRPFHATNDRGTAIFSEDVNDSSDSEARASASRARQPAGEACVRIRPFRNRSTSSPVASRLRSKATLMLEKIQSSQKLSLQPLAALPMRQSLVQNKNTAASFTPSASSFARPERLLLPLPRVRRSQLQKRPAGSPGRSGWYRRSGRERWRPCPRAARSAWV